jgi:hypothetical protein
MNTGRQYDAIDTISHLGYSEREAAFLYTVGVHSGYFLRRQFTAFVQRERGAIATHFLRKAQRFGHVREIQCETGRSLYQLYSRMLYRILSGGDSQNRRAKSTREIRRRLILLDYVLSRLGHGEFMDSPNSRQGFLTKLGVDAEALGTSVKFGEPVPLSVHKTEYGLQVRLSFVDEGQRSLAKFERFLKTHDRLLCTLPDFEVVYVATTPQHFENARRMFDHNFPEVATMATETSMAADSRGATKAPRATFSTELITASYPSSLNADPGYSGGLGRNQGDEQSLLFSKEMPDDTG